VQNTQCTMYSGNEAASTGIDKSILNLISLLSKKLVRRYWSESLEDLIQEGLLLTLELYRKKPDADKEWIYKALHNFYSSKRKKIRRYEKRRVDETNAPESRSEDAELESSIEDADLELVSEMIELGMEKEEILDMLGSAKRTMYRRINAQS
jgi:DNA-directed RNA polymerase specialized sigma24 family protein